MSDPRPLHERDPKLFAVLQRLYDCITQQRCVVCDVIYTRLEQIGPCVYSLPCNHRQWVGTLPDATPEAEEEGDEWIPF